MALDTLHIILIVVLIAILIWAFSNSRGRTEYFTQMNSNTNTNTNTRKIVKLWVDHLIYDRLAMMAFFNDDPELPFIKDRVKTNANELGELVGKLFGSQAGETVTNEMNKHITIASKLRESLKNGDTRNQRVYMNEFFANATDIGNYFDKLFGTTKFKHHLMSHAKILVGDIDAYVSMNYPSDIEYLDAFISSGLDMAFDMAELSHK